MNIGFVESVPPDILAGVIESNERDCGNSVWQIRKHLSSQSDLHLKSRLPHFQAGVL